MCMSIFMLHPIKMQPASNLSPWAQQCNAVNTGLSIAVGAGLFKRTFISCAKVVAEESHHKFLRLQRNACIAGQTGKMGGFDGLGIGHHRVCDGWGIIIEMQNIKQWPTRKMMCCSLYTACACKFFCSTTCSVFSCCARSAQLQL